MGTKTKSIKEIIDPTKSAVSRAPRKVHIHVYSLHDAYGSYAKADTYQDLSTQEAEGLVADLGGTIYEYRLVAECRTQKSPVKWEAVH